MIISGSRGSFALREAVLLISQVLAQQKKCQILEVFPCSNIAVVRWQKAGKVWDTAVESSIYDLKDNSLKF